MIAPGRDGGVGVQLPACQVYRHQDGRIEFVHRVVVLQTVGRGVPVGWGPELQRPKEQEAAAPLRALRKVHSRHAHFTHVLTLDAHYAKAPVIREIRRLGFQGQYPGLGVAGAS
ncbi:MAG: hypothetical protein AB1609_12190 [Bacillota bacterium]